MKTRKSSLLWVLLAIVFIFPITTNQVFAVSTKTISARALLLKLTVKAENNKGYARTFFKTWIDADKDKCDTRAEVLISESLIKPALGSNCKIISGKWKSWYDDKTWTKPSDVDIDHVVPLKEAWDSGAYSWTSDSRTKYANDLDFAWTLDAITDNINSSKGDRDPSQWLPPLSSTHCAYATHWVAIKYRWRLTIDSMERDALSKILTGTCGNKTLSLPKQAI
jgi:hypothetical protein